MHIDLNAFFASAEEIRDPSLKGKPILIGHEGRSGIVSTASYAARKAGCHSGQPMFQALRLCPEAKVIAPDFSYYKVLSVSFFSYLKEYSPIIEQASIDEAYVDMSKPLGKCADPIGYLRSMQFRLKKLTGLSCSIGIAPTKWLAKMGSDLHKPMGLTIIRRKDIGKTILPLPIEKFWGIGKKTCPELKAIGIKTIGDLRDRLVQEDEDVMRILGKFAFTALSWMSGRGDDKVQVEADDPKSIGNSTTLPIDCCGYDEVAKAVSDLCDEVSERAKAQHKAGFTITLTVKDTAFRLHTRAVTLKEPTDDAKAIKSKVEELYKRNFEAMDVRLVGVTLSKLVDPLKRTVQMTIFNYEYYEQADKTRMLINQMNRKMKKPLLMRGSEAKKDGED